MDELFCCHFVTGDTILQTGRNLLKMGATLKGKKLLPQGQVLLLKWASEGTQFISQLLVWVTIWARLLYDILVCKKIFFHGLNP